MKRNSTTLFLESPNATTPIPWVNDAPNFSGFDDPTLSVLVNSWNEFIGAGGVVEIIPDPVPSIDNSPQWEAFNRAFLADANWQSVSVKIPPQLLMGITAAAATANISALQSAYNMIKETLSMAEQDIPIEVLRGWQALADQYYIGIIFK